MKKLTLSQAKSLMIAHLKKQMNKDLQECGDVGIQADTREMYEEDFQDIKDCDTVTELWIAAVGFVFKNERIEILKALVNGQPKTKRTKGK